MNYNNCNAFVLYFGFLNLLLYIFKNRIKAVCDRFEMKLFFVLAALAMAVSVVNGYSDDDAWKDYKVRQDLFFLKL